MTFDVEVFFTKKKKIKPKMRKKEKNKEQLTDQTINGLKTKIASHLNTRGKDRG